MAENATTPLLSEHNKVTDTLRIQIEGMSCSSCANTLENGVKDVEGVERVAVGVATKMMIVWHNEVNEQKLVEEVLDRIQCLGFDGVVDQEREGKTRDAFHEKIKTSGRKTEAIIKISVLLTGPLLVLSLFAGRILPDKIDAFLQLAMGTIVQCYCGRSFYVKAFHGLKRGKLGMDFLVIC